MTALSPPRQRAATWTRPWRLSGLVFDAKVWAFRARRALRDVAGGPARLAKAEAPELVHTIAESRTPLWSDDSLAEQAMQVGKVQNLRVACRALDGLVIPAGAVFSVWRHLGPPTRARGYVAGRMLREGCMTPATGGGLCQLSNALYEVALQAGCRIVERHPHSRVVPGSVAAAGRDATIAWNYVDLRFAPEQAVRLYARMDEDSLTVRLLAAQPGAPVSVNSAGLDAAPELAEARSCGSCAEVDCFRHEGGGASVAYSAATEETVSAGAAGISFK